MWGNSVSSHSLLHNANIHKADQCSIILPIATRYNTGLLRKCSCYEAENAKIRNCPSIHFTLHVASMYLELPKICELKSVVFTHVVPTVVILTDVYSSTVCLI